MTLEEKNDRHRNKKTKMTLEKTTVETEGEKKRETKELLLGN